MKSDILNSKKYKQWLREKRTKRLLFGACVGLVGIGVGIGVGYPIFSSNQNGSNLTINSWVDFDQYFETHHDEYKTPDTPLDLNDASQDEIIDYFFSHKRISGQNLLYSMCLDWANMTYSDFDSPLKLKTNVTDNSASVKLVSDFETSRVSSRNGSETSFGITEYALFKKGSSMKVELSRYSINYELNLTYVTWAKTTNIYESSEIFYGNQNENYSETKYYNNDSIRLNDDVSITASPSNLGLNIKIDWGNGLKNIPNPYNIDILNLYFNPEWYPNVIPGADPKI